MKETDILKEELTPVETQNWDFVQVYPEGWDRLLSLPSRSPHVARLYAFLAKHIAPLGGAVCVSYETIAEALDISMMTARRAAEYLVDNGVVVRFKMGTGAFIYALNPDEVWKSANKNKKFAAFHTQSVVLRRDTDALKSQVRMLRSKSSTRKSKSAANKKKVAREDDRSTDHS